jgi:hypothetical protein
VIGDLRERVIGRGEDRAALHVFDEEGMAAPYSSVVVFGGAQKADKPEVTVVLGFGRALRRIDEAHVGPRIRRKLADFDPRESRVPPRRVVRALPGVVDGDQTGALGVAALHEVAVPGHELRVQSGGSRLEGAPRVLGNAFGACDLEDPPHRDGVHRRLDETAGRERGRRCAHIARTPEIWAGPVIRDLRVEHDVRDAAVRPLRLEQVLELLERARRIEMSEPDRDERAVPAPLVRIETRRRLRPAADIVRAQHSSSGGPEICIARRKGRVCAGRAQCGAATALPVVSSIHRILCGSGAS